MFLSTLRTLNFRNLKPLTINPHPRFNIIHGHNGQGKTNLLEAIYLLSSPKSFRPHNNLHLIQFDQSSATIEAKLNRNGSERLIRLEYTPQKKSLFVNNSPIHNQSSYFGSVNIVTFSPEDIMLIKGPPAGRRNFMDRIIENAQPAYSHELDAYENVLNQRNALLRSDVVDQALLEIYSEQLVYYGSQIQIRRLDFVDNFRPVLKNVFQSIFEPNFNADLHYNLQADSIVNHNELFDLTPYQRPFRSDQRLKEDLEAVFRAALVETALQERHRGFTLVGPNRDDLITTLNDRDVKTFSSQGQHRGFVLALKIGEIQYLEERYHFAPILLLDDVSSELDEKRNSYFFKYLGDRDEGQVFITTTDPNYILLDRGDSLLYKVVNGEVV